MTDKQTKKASLVEALLNVVIGYGIACFTQIVVLRAFGFPISVGESLTLGLIFTVISIARSFCLRRWFEYLRVKGILS